MRSRCNSNVQTDPTTRKEMNVETSSTAETAYPFPLSRIHRTSSRSHRSTGTGNQLRRCCHRSESLIVRESTGSTDFQTKGPKRYLVLACSAATRRIRLSRSVPHNHLRRDYCARTEPTAIVPPRGRRARKAAVRRHERSHNGVYRNSSYRVKFGVSCDRLRRLQASFELSLVRHG